MRRIQLPRTIALTLTCALTLAASARMLRADDAAPAKEPAAEAPAADAAPPEAPKTEVAPASEMMEEVKLVKVDAEGKTVTILVPPDRGKSGRAYKQIKFTLDDNSLVMVDQQPSSVAALQKGMIVNLSHFKKGKVETVDTIVVIKGAEE